MKHLWLLTKNLLYLAIVPGVVAGWLPLRVFERHTQWPDGWGPAQWASLLPALAGTVVLLVATRVFATRGQGTPAFIDPPRKLVRRGPYKWVRNPMYLSLAALVGAEGLFFQSWHIGVYWVCLVCVLHLVVVLHEETALRFRFGAMYEDYRREVPRWLPRKPRPALQTVAPFDLRR